LERGMAWTEISAKIDAKYEGEAMAEYRSRIKDGIREFAGGLNFAYRKMDDAQKRRFVNSYREFTENKKAVSVDPSYVPQFVCTADFWVPARILEYASELCEGIDNYFVCRDETCGNFSPNTCWMQEYRPRPDSEAYYKQLWDPKAPFDLVLDAAPPVASELHHFRCSLCGTEFQPWQKKSHFIPANKILVSSPAGDVALAKAMGMEPNAVSFRYHYWTDTATTVMVGRLTEIALKLCETTRGMTYGELHEHCVQQINGRAERSYFTQCQIPKKTLLDVNRINSGVYGDKKKWRYDYLLDGFLSAKAPPFVRKGPGQTHVMDSDEFVTMFAYTKTLCGIVTAQSSL
jgi:hypothetical protein